MYTNKQITSESVIHGIPSIMYNGVYIGENYPTIKKRTDEQIRNFK